MDAKKELLWILGILAVLWIIWFFTGGPQRWESRKPFITPYNEQGGGELYGPR